MGSNQPDFFGEFGSLQMAMYSLFSAGTVIDNVSDLTYRMKDQQSSYKASLDKNVTTKNKVYNINTT